MTIVGEVAFHPQQRFDSELESSFLELQMPRDFAVICDRDGPLVILDCPLNQLSGSRDSVEKGMFRVNMQMDEVFCQGVPHACLGANRALYGLD